MFKIPKVVLKDGKDNVKFVAGKKNNPSFGNNDDDREFQCGLSVFYNDKQVLNFVLLEDEIELLLSDSKVMALNDIGYNLFASTWKLQLLQYRCKTSSYSSSDFEYLGISSNGDDAYGENIVFRKFCFIGKNEYAFTDAIRCAMQNPCTYGNLFCEVPNDGEGQEF